MAEAEVAHALLAVAYGRLRLSVLMTLVVVPAFAGLLLPLFPATGLWLWVGLVLLVASLRLGLWWAWQRRPAVRTAAARWRHGFLAGAVLAGASWAAGPVLLMPPAGHTETMLLLLTLLAVSAVAMTSLAAQLAAMWGFLLAALAPTALALLADGGQVEMLAAAVLAAALLALMTAGHISSRSIRSLLHTELRLSQSVAQTHAALQRAEAASQAKTRFLATMSHELRTPLNAVIGAAQLMRAGDADAAQRAHLVDAIQRSGANLLGLIENILDLARIEAGELVLSAEDFPLGDCVDAALATTALAARVQGLQLACVIDPGLPAVCHGDASRLRQVLMNLLGNAVKFTPAGEVLLRLAPGQVPGELHLSVQDSGVGIAPEALPHIFEAFRQGDEGAGRRFGGSGLGLAIVHQLVQAMGGRIGVHSRPGEGARFDLWLPLPAAAQQPPASGADAGAARPVAYVEPHGPSAEALHALLLRHGCVPTPCRSADELLAWCRRSAGARPAPRLLVCTDSAETADLLEAAAELLEPASVIGMSRQEAGDADHARLRCSLPASLVKPVAGAALAARLDDAADALPPPVPQALLSDAELERLVHVLVVEDDPLNQTIVSRLLHHAGCRVSTADNGVEALALLRHQTVHLVLMDCQMPGMDGLEVTRRLRAGQAGAAARRLPIVALTANAFAEDRAACLAAGMDDFLSKPVLAQTLVAAVVRWAGRPLLVPRMPGQAGATTAGTAAAVYDPAVLQGLPMVADGSQPGCVQEMLDLFNDSLADLLESLPAQLRLGQAAAARRALHGLKSAAASVGALALAAVAAEGEDLLHTAGDRAGVADTASLDHPALQALPARLREASAAWHLALARQAASVHGEGQPC